MMSLDETPPRLTLSAAALPTRDGKKPWISAVVRVKKKLPEASSLNTDHLGELHFTGGKTVLLSPLLPVGAVCVHVTATSCYPDSMPGQRHGRYCITHGRSNGGRPVLTRELPVLGMFVG
jgi:hypothetical protein